MERLQPLEKLDKDYYLGEQAGWYSDGENHDSERFVAFSIHRFLFGLESVRCWPHSDSLRSSIQWHVHNFYNLQSDSPVWRSLWIIVELCIDIMTFFPHFLVFWQHECDSRS